MIPITINTIQIIRIILIGSLNKIIPKTTVPTVPIPVQIAYALPSGKLFKNPFHKLYLPKISK
jgi:hypothetical protein